MLLRGLTVAATILLAAGLASVDDISEKAAACSGCHGENGVPTGKPAKMKVPFFERLSSIYA